MSKVPPPRSKTAILKLEKKVQYALPKITKNLNIDLHFVVGLVHAVGQCSSCGLVDDPENIEARNLTSILGSLPLGIVEVLKRP